MVITSETRPNHPENRGGIVKRTTRSGVRIATCVLMALALLILMGSPKVFALGHYGIPGTFEGGCDVCHDFVDGGYAPASGNLRWVRSTIEWPAGTIHSGVSYTQTSSTLPADGTMADGNDSDLDGPCEVCHTATNYHTNFGDGTIHLDGQYCTACHPHFSDDITDYFQPSFTGTQSHTTHWTDPKGPQLGQDTCSVCHLSSDFSLFADGLPLSTTTACDPCHSPGGTYDGSAHAKANWETAVYEENGADLKTGNDNWCESCHDGGTSLVNGIYAPDVMGDNTSWGYDQTGHGKFSVGCKDCHDFALEHTDGESRTYSASLDNYRSGYRLNEDMAVPRDGEIHPDAFRLCTQCHVYSEVTGDESNFRDDGSGSQFHEMHLNWWPAFFAADTDFDGVNCIDGACQDSAMTCITCHNVHGPPNPAMIRHGELISTPGTTDKVPALDFRWYTSDGSTETTILNESRYGSLVCGLTPNVSVNNVCSGCHGTGQLTWFRNPHGQQGITLDAVWTTDTNNVTKTEFYPTEAFRVHTSFTLVGTGSGPYLVQIKNSAVGNSASMPGTDWSYPLAKQGTVGSGSYEVQWQGEIPSASDPGSPAMVRMRIYVYDSTGETLLDSDEKLWNFSIVAAP